MSALNYYRDLTAVEKRKIEAEFQEMALAKKDLAEVEEKLKSLDVTYSWRGMTKSLTNVPSRDSGYIDNRLEKNFLEKEKHQQELLEQQRVLQKKARDFERTKEHLKYYFPHEWRLLVKLYIKKIKRQEIIESEFLTDQKGLYRQRDRVLKRLAMFWDLKAPTR